MKRFLALAFLVVCAPAARAPPPPRAPPAPPPGVGGPPRAPAPVRLVCDRHAIQFLHVPGSVTELQEWFPGAVSPDFLLMVDPQAHEAQFKSSLCHRTPWAPPLLVKRQAWKSNDGEVVVRCRLGEDVTLWVQVRKARTVTYVGTGGQAWASSTHEAAGASPAAWSTAKCKRPS